MTLDEIRNKSELFEAHPYDEDDEDEDVKELRDSLRGMEAAFNRRGDVTYWTPELLQDVDEAFKNNYIVEEGGTVVPFLFFSEDMENLNTFTSYCAQVDQALRKHATTVGPYAREYFAYYSIWQMRGWNSRCSNFSY